MGLITCRLKIRCSIELSSYLSEGKDINHLFQYNMLLTAGTFCTQVPSPDQICSGEFLSICSNTAKYLANNCSILDLVCLVLVLVSVCYHGADWKWCQPCPTDHLYIFICANYSFLPCAFRLNINIYLFTSSNQCQQNHTLATTCIYLFMQINCCLHILIEWILISICLLIQINFNKTTPSDHLYLFIYANYLLFHVLFKWILISICLLIQRDVNRTTR